MYRKYSITDFNKEFPNDEACLDHVFKTRFPRLKGYKKMKGRLCYQNGKGHQIYPLVGTPFEGSRTPLKLWFYAIYLFSVSRNGVSAAALQRQLGVTYKCAWRMGHQIRIHLKEEKKLQGIVECDEVWVGGKRRLEVRDTDRNKTPVLGMVERGGRVVMKPITTNDRMQIHEKIEENVRKGSEIISDGHMGYRYIDEKGYKHRFVNHSKWEYVREEKDMRVHTNTCEGVWSHLRGQINGTHRYVSPQHLTKYLNEISFRYNYRGQTLFPVYLLRVLT